jgi:RNA polymerase sigma-70 factor, ECF subfamily
VELRVEEPGSATEELLSLYDRALPEVYGYLLRRARSRVIAEDLTADTLFAALRSAREGRVQFVTIAWFIGIARHKLVDHWRLAERHAGRS